MYSTPQTIAVTAQSNLNAERARSDLWWLTGAARHGTVARSDWISRADKRNSAFAGLNRDRNTTFNTQTHA